MWHTEHGAFQYAGECIQLRLNLLRIDVVASADHYILGAAHDVHVTVAIDAAEITRLEPAIRSKFAARFLGISPITGEHIRTCHLERADDIGSWFGASGRTDHADFNPRQRHANRTRLAHP